MEAAPNGGLCVKDMVGIPIILYHSLCRLDAPKSIFVFCGKRLALAG